MHELDFSLGKSDDAERAAAALAFMMKAQADEWLLKEQARLEGARRKAAATQACSA